MRMRLLPPAPRRRRRARGERQDARGPRAPFSSGVSHEAQSIATAEHCLEEPGLTVLELDLVAKVFDVRVDGALVAFELVTSDLVDQFISGVDATRDPGESGEDAPLSRGELDGFASYDHAPSVVIDDELAATI